MAEQIKLDNNTIQMIEQILSRKGNQRVELVKEHHAGVPCLVVVEEPERKLRYRQTI